MILKYRTTSLTSPPHTSFSYIDNISHFTPIYNPSTSTLTVNLTLRTPYHIPTSLVLNDLAFLLTDDGKFLDKVFDSNPSANSSSNSQHNSSHFSYRPKPYKPYNKSYYKKPYYKRQQYQNTSLENTDTNDASDDSE